MSRTLLNNLPDVYVRYELACRGKDPCQYSMSERKLVLFDVMQAERNGAPGGVIAVIPIEDDLEACDSLLNKLVTAFNLNKNTEAEKTGDCLSFLIPRIKRIQARNEKDGEFKETILRCAIELQENVSDVAIALCNEPTPTVFDMSSIRANLGARSSPNILNPPSVSNSSQAFPISVARNVNNEVGYNCFPNKVKVPVYKWGLKFSGKYEKDKMTPTEFVSRSMDYMLSRNISECELYASAIDLFEGTAYQWFKALGNLGDQYPNNWRELSARLLTDFERPDYLYDLEDHIRNRKQKPNESVVEFFAYIEGAFLRLNREVPQGEQIRILRRNIDSKYKQAIVFEDFRRVEQLKDACKKLEELEFVKRREPDSRQVRFNSSTHFAQFDSFDQPSGSNRNQNFQEPFNRNHNSNYTNKYRGRTPSPADARNDPSYFRSSNRRWGDSPLPDYSRRQSPERPNNSYYRNRNVHSNLPPVSTSNSRFRKLACEKCELVDGHERFCPNKLNGNGTTSSRSPVVPPQGLANDL